MKRQTVTWVAVLLAVLLAAGACDEPGRVPDGIQEATLGPSGIRGRVMLGPTCARPAAAATPCLRPYSARLLVLDDAGEVVAEVTSGEDGRFAVALPPGVYVIAPVAGGDPLPNAKPQTVTVGEEEVVEVGIEYDTGVR